MPQPQHPSSTNWTRRRIIQAAGLMGGSFLIAIFGRKIWRTTSSQQKPDLPEKPELSLSPTPTPTPTPTRLNTLSGLMLKVFSFETVTVDAKGNITNRGNLEAQYFTLYLGNGVTLDMVQIPGGTFTMGSPAEEADRNDSEGPQRQVKVPGFFMGKYEVTKAQYEAIMGKNPSDKKGNKLPVANISWNDAVEFCNQLSQKTGRTYRLPSEAEWEYACRAGTTTPFHFGETITTEIANYNGKGWAAVRSFPSQPGNYGQGPTGKFRNHGTDVDTFSPNAFGLYDMHGNMWEWCQDTWHNYEEAPTDGRPWTSNGNPHRIARGGSWRNIPLYCRSASRHSFKPDYDNANVGLRVVYVVDGVQ